MSGPWSQIQAFLSNAIPWPQGSFTNIHAFQVEPNGKITPRASRAAQSLQEAVSFCQWCDAQGWEVYACMAAQRQPGVGKPDKRGRTNYRALRGEANAVVTRSFYVDVDVKEGAYQSSQEALEAFKAFLAATGLPAPSIIVWSGGGGFHAHWLLDQPVDPATWKPVALKLAAACRHHGFKADTAVTVDVVRILRVPGTLNRKYDAGRTVTMDIIGTQQTLDTLMRVLEPYADIQPQPKFSGSAPSHSQVTGLELDPKIFPSLTTQLNQAIVQKFLAGTELEDPTLAEVASGCPLIANALATGGKGYPEPLWFETGKVAQFTTDGVAGFHAMSKGYAGYDPREVDEKYDYITSSQQTNDRGWPRCLTIENAGSTLCGNCHNRTLNRSPLNFARKIQAAPQVTPASNPVPPASRIIVGSQLPPTPVAVDGYMQDPTTGIVSTTIDEVEVQVWSYPIWNLDAYETKNANRSIFSIHFDTRYGQHVVIPTGALGEARQLREVILKDHGLALPSKQTTLLSDFMNSFLSQLHAARQYTQQDNIGWATENGKLSGFAYGSVRYNCAGNVPFHASDSYIKGTYSPRGSFQPWQDAMAMIHGEQRPAMELLVATAFAAPLMRFTGQSGVVAMGCSAGSAYHKSTGLKVAQTVWGSVEGINHLIDTGNTTVERLGRIKVLPSYYDEMKASDQLQDFAKLVMTLSIGRSKGRLTRNAEIRDVSTWDTMLVGASNESLISHLITHDRSTEAGINRVFEFEVDPPNLARGQIAMGEAGKILAALKDNYGHAGTAYAELLGKSVDKLQQWVTDMVNTYEKALNSTQDERFWVAFMAATTVGAQLANDLKLTRFKMDDMANFMVRATARLRSMRSYSEVNITTTAGIASTIGFFLNSNRKGTIVSDVLYANVGRPGGMAVVNVRNSEFLNNSDKMVAQIAQDDHIIRISKRHFVEWCEKNKQQHAILLNDIKEKLGGNFVRARLGSGTRFGTASKEYLIELDSRHPDLAPYLSN